MSGGSTSIVSRVIDRVLPRMPDFYGFINEQCEQLCQALEVYVEFMETGDAAAGDRVRAMEKEGDELKARHMEILNRAFATPMDREDIYRAIVTLDEILNYAKTTVREVEALQVVPDEHMAEMARLIYEGARALRDGYAMMATNPKGADVHAAAARKSERRTEKVYRAALAELFHAKEHIEALGNKAENAEANAMTYVFEVFKRREIYRHLSNGADRVEHAASVLHDIIVQIA